MLCCLVMRKVSEQHPFIFFLRQLSPIKLQGWATNIVFLSQGNPRLRLNQLHYCTITLGRQIQFPPKCLIETALLSQTLHNFILLTYYALIICAFLNGNTYDILQLNVIVAKPFAWAINHHKLGVYWMGLLLQIHFLLKAVTLETSIILLCCNQMVQVGRGLERGFSRMKISSVFYQESKKRKRKAFISNLSK